MGTNRDRNKVASVQRMKQSRSGWWGACQPEAEKAKKAGVSEDVRLSRQRPGPIGSQGGPQRD